MTIEEYREEGFRLYGDDMAKAVEYFKKAAEGNDIISAIVLAGYYYDEEGEHGIAAEWLDKAFEWYEDADKPEGLKDYYAVAETLMGKIIYESISYYDFPKATDALKHFINAVQNGDDNALAYIGMYFFDGYDTPDALPNYLAAFDIWRQGAEKGNEMCKSLLEDHKYEYVGEPSDPEKVTFDNGDVYYGDINIDGQPHGIGHMDYKLNGYDGEYDGEWRNGKRSGMGHYHKSSIGGRKYIDDYKGEWLDDKEHGFGISYSSKEEGLHLSTVGTTYKGGFREGKRHGHGILIEDDFDGSFSNGKNYYEGEFENDILKGHAVCEYANGDTFEGEFNGGKNGHGIYTFANGKKFEGEWENDRLDINSIKSDPSLNTPVLLITEHHSGFDYNHTGTFLIVAEVGERHYEDTMLISKDTSFNMRYTFNIIEVTPDSVTFEVKSDFAPDHKAFNETIHRGETKYHENSHDAVATIYDDDYDYTIKSSLQVKCV